MTRRIFVTVKRGMTDETAVCVFPWEKRLLERIHGGQVEDRSIDEMCELHGPVKIERNRVQIKREGGEKPDVPPNLREQLEAMTRVDPDEDPMNDPAAEYNRLSDKYGMDNEVKLSVVALIYGQFDSGAFEAAMKAASAPAPKKAAAQASERPIEKMTINELRANLRQAGIDFDATATKEQLADLLATATA
jgi:hypothetical protein